MRYLLFKLEVMLRKVLVAVLFPIYMYVVENHAETKPPSLYPTNRRRLNVFGRFVMALESEFVYWEEGERRIDGLPFWAVVRGDR